ncbi:Aldo/keto reductase [Patellaria atrata CBS 101060]|uniref:Aldo/keto reductase n=1 Tax=Patellaria atrata CBS 101060 TaxID=1346257 RepID=A0A9P4SEW9_9PEZI|nr:Aldo/keto reductase [Patellaria atrata CBS 101060]
MRSLTTAAFAAFSLASPIAEQIPITPFRSQPLIGFGTWNLDIFPENTTAAVSIALQAGYRQIDCAAAYGNEKAVGKGIAEGMERANLQRWQIWVTSKLWNDHHAVGKVEEGLNQTLKDLGLDYLDLYLMHWPVGNAPITGKLRFDYIETWHAMEKLLDTGKVRNIGVSNFSRGQLHRLIKSSKVKPAVHQMELHPYLHQEKWIRMHQAHGIAVTAYSPLGNMNPTYHDDDSDDTESPPLLLKNPVILNIARKRSCTAAQVALAWGMSRGTSVIPKSSHEDHIRENIGATECHLQKEDFREIVEVGRKWSTRFNNPGEGWGVHLFEGLEDS